MTETYARIKLPPMKSSALFSTVNSSRFKKWDGDLNEKGEKIMVRDDEGTVAARKAKLIQTKFLELDLERSSNARID